MFSMFIPCDDKIDASRNRNFAFKDNAVSEWTVRFQEEISVSTPGERARKKFAQAIKNWWKP